MDSNHEKWNGVFLSSIGKVLRERFSQGLTLSTDAMQYLDNLLLRLLISLLTPVPKTLQDAQDQIARRFPEPLSSGALADSKRVREKGKKKVLISVDKVHHIVKDCSSGNPDKQVSLFLAAVLEYMLSDILKLTVNYVQNISREEIKDQDIKIAMFADKVLVNIFQGDEVDEDFVLLPVATSDDAGDESYATLARNFLSEEQRYLRDLQLIIKFFKKAFTDKPKIFSEADVEQIFCNIEDIAEMSTKLIVILEEAAEMTDESNPVPLIGNCFEELAEECSFELYSDYTLNFTEGEWNEKFHKIVSRPPVQEELKKDKPEGFRDMVVYVLPNLLVAPIYHCLHYFDQIQMLERRTDDKEDRESYNQTISAISPIKVTIESKVAAFPKTRPSEATLRISWKGGVQMEKMKEIEESIEGWYGKTITQMCNEFVYEGDLSHIIGKKTSERRVFLLDSLLVCCKSNQGRRPMPSVTMTHEFKLKDKILLRKTIVSDDEENERQFIVTENSPSGETKTKWIFQAHSVQEKRSWMSHLIRLQCRSTYDRMLDQRMREEQQKQPLRLPPCDAYRFLEPDSPQNLVTDQDKKSLLPSIKGGTVRKLVERLTYHKHYDSSFTKTFLTTFRSFCKPQLLLDLLIERFNIPEPPPSEEQRAALDRGEIITRDDLKRFRNEYAQPVQLRVMNVLRQWLEYHWYDFEADSLLLRRVEDFVAVVKGKNMQKWARTMSKIIAKKKDSEEEPPIPFFPEGPPPVEWHLTHEKENYSIMTLHPIEIARQLTLLEFDLYRKVQPSELVGTVWTKAGKEENSPNLLRMIHCSTTITRWLSKSIVETKNFEERTAVMSRAIEIMQVLKQLNNFNGLLEFVAAFNSSAIHRLNHTKQNLPDRLSKILRECMDLCDPRLTKTLEKLRSCDPPCVPFVGTFLTNILKTEEGNPHLLPNYPEELELINFAKRRMVASILFDIQQYQNQPYNLMPVPEIRNYLTSLQPLKGYTEKQLNDYLFQCSLEVEPRHSDRAARFPRMYNDKEIKSPGTVPSKKSKTMQRDESRISLLDRNQMPEEESIQPSVPTPKTPITPDAKEPLPPPRPPRRPVHDSDSAPTSSMGNIFSFPPVGLSTPPLVARDVSVEGEDTPPPLPPRDDIPYPKTFYSVESESFRNDVMLIHHRPMYYDEPDPYPDFMLSDQANGLEAPFNPIGISYSPQTEPQLRPHLFQPVFDPSPGLESVAPPVPPRDPPVVPPRDPPPLPVSMSSSDNYPGIRYVPDPTRFTPGISRFSSGSGNVPPPVPRRQPSAPSL